MDKFNSPKLKGIIAASGKRQYEVAKILDVHTNTIGNWVNGNASPTPQQLQRLLIGLGYEVATAYHERLGDWYPLNGS